MDLQLFVRLCSNIVKEIKGNILLEGKSTSRGTKSTPPPPNSGKYYCWTLSANDLAQAIIEWNV